MTLNEDVKQLRKEIKQLKKKVRKLQMSVYGYSETDKKGD